MNITDITPVKQESTSPIRLAAYCRVSSKSEDQIHSFEAQIRYYSEYTQQNPQYQLVDIYADEITGTSMKKRDDFNRLIRDCKKGKIDRIIVKSISRFARNTEELLVTLRMLKELNVSVYFEEQGIDTNKLNSEMIVTFPGMAAQQESETISKNMRWSIKKRMENGEFNTCYPAYGFDMVNGELVINPNESKVVRRIFDMYLQGIGKQTIASKLNSEGICRRGNNGKWRTTTIGYILNNERYTGDAVLQKSYTTDILPFRRKHNCGEQPQYYVENSNPAIIDHSIYNAVQSLMSERQKNYKGRTTNTTFLLSGILRCSNCGKALRRQIISDKVYWSCPGQMTGEDDCKNIRVSEDDVYDTFIMMSVKLIDNRKYLIETLLSQIEDLQCMANANTSDIQIIDKSIADLNARCLVIAKLHTKGILSIADYTAQSSELANKISALRIERRKLISNDESDVLIEELNQLNSILKNTPLEYEFNTRLFENIVESITVNGRDKLSFKLIGDIELTEDIQYRG